MDGMWIGQLVGVRRRLMLIFCCPTVSLSGHFVILFRLTVCRPSSPLMSGRPCILVRYYIVQELSGVSPKLTFSGTLRPNVNFCNGKPRMKTV